MLAILAICCIALYQLRDKILAFLPPHCKKHPFERENAGGLLKSRMPALTRTRSQIVMALAARAATRLIYWITVLLPGPPSRMS